MPLRRFTLRSAAGIEVELVDLGAAVEVIRAPDRHGAVDGVTFSLVSPDGDMGFPGTLTAAVHYRHHLEFRLTTDASEAP